MYMSSAKKLHRSGWGLAVTGQKYKPQDLNQTDIVVAGVIALPDLLNFPCVPPGVCECLHPIARAPVSSSEDCSWALEDT